MLITTLKQRIGFAPKPRHIFAAAQIALVVGILLSRLDHQVPVLDFFEGVLIGFSIAGNLAGLVNYSRRQGEKGSHHG